jgi:hypothetical protein
LLLDSKALSTSMNGSIAAANGDQSYQLVVDVALGYIRLVGAMARFSTVDDSKAVAVVRQS